MTFGKDVSDTNLLCSMAFAICVQAYDLCMRWRFPDKNMNILYDTKKTKAV